MRCLSFAVIAMLFSSGCARLHSTITTTQVKHGQEELEVLSSELDIRVRQLIALQNNLATNCNYSTAAKTRDLADAISIVRQARDKLAARYEQLHEEFHISHGDY